MRLPIPQRRSCRILRCREKKAPVELFAGERRQWLARKYEVIGAEVARGVLCSAVAQADNSHVRVRGAREHNLKNVDVAVPRDTLVVFTGVSGTGKSSLTFGTIYAKAQRRYFESVAPYARRLIRTGEGREANARGAQVCQAVPLPSDPQRRSRFGKQ
jgi:hypothetical protein